MRKLLSRFPVSKLVTTACYLAVFALLLMIWSVVDPRALPVVLGMSVGQGIGVLAFLCFLLAMLSDAQRASSPPE